MSNRVHALQRPVTWIIGYVEFVIKDTDGSLSALQEAMRLQPIIMPGMAFFPPFKSLYAPCFPVRLGVAISPCRVADPRRYGFRVYACIRTCAALAGY